LPRNVGVGPAPPSYLQEYGDLLRFDQVDVDHDRDNTQRLESDYPWLAADDPAIDHERSSSETDSDDSLDPDGSHQLRWRMHGSKSNGVGVVDFTGSPEARAADPPEDPWELPTTLHMAPASAARRNRTLTRPRYLMHSPRL
jgi:hypothetical protein